MHKSCVFTWMTPPKFRSTKMTTFPFTLKQEISIFQVCLEYNQKYKCMCTFEVLVLQFRYPQTEYPWLNGCSMCILLQIIEVLLVSLEKISVIFNLSWCE